MSMLRKILHINTLLLEHSHTGSMDGIPPPTSNLSLSLSSAQPATESSSIEELFVGGSSDCAGGDGDG